jgi:hypothetical protein
LLVLKSNENVWAGVETPHCGAMATLPSMVEQIEVQGQKGLYGGCVVDGAKVRDCVGLFGCSMFNVCLLAGEV